MKHSTLAFVKAFLVRRRAECQDSFSVFVDFFNFLAVAKIFSSHPPLPAGTTARQAKVTKEQKDLGDFHTLILLFHLLLLFCSSVLRSRIDPRQKKPKGISDGLNGLEPVRMRGQHPTAHRAVATTRSISSLVGPSNKSDRRAAIEQKPVKEQD